ncbi:plant ubx domain-containing protein 8 [Quercus suber]|uniref:Plant ubx domain-containing protein 8 n=1 Tax=Quercus suber TaxID=58331 RepID=A0AAW0L371_QUESU
MARPSQQEIDTFVAITGASESIALRKLEVHFPHLSFSSLYITQLTHSLTHSLCISREHGGNLNEAVNAHYGDVGRHMYGISV